MKAPEADRSVAGREAFRAERWSEAARLLAEADAEVRLAPEDYEALATARFLISPDQRGAEIMGQATLELVARGDPARAARAAFWAGATLLRLGQTAAGSGWIRRGRRLLDEASLDCVERGYLLVPGVFDALRGGDAHGAAILIEEATVIARRFGDDDLLTLLYSLDGRARLLRGDISGGMAVLDDVMVTATTARMSPLLVGMLFCNVIMTAQHVHDYGRAREWTAAVERWRNGQPDLELYRGECQVQRARVLRIAGDWLHAQDQITSACTVLTQPPPQPAAGLALYEQGELHRLSGRNEDAEAAYSQAAALGHGAQPGLALLRLGQGRVEAARAGIARALAESGDPLVRAALLPAAVEIALAAGQVEEAKAAATELVELATGIGSDYLRAQADVADGSVRVAQGEAAAALSPLRRAAVRWQQLQAAHALARTRLLIGEACQSLGDADAARLEIKGARDTFARLGAAPDVRRSDLILAREASWRLGGLTEREAELLALLATGRTNREIASRLCISEKTVARHVSNIFNKIGVSSRAAATAYALKHGLA